MATLEERLRNMELGAGRRASGSPTIDSDLDRRLADMERGQQQGTATSFMTASKRQTSGGLTSQTKGAAIPAEKAAGAPVARGSTYLTGGGAAPAPSYGAGAQARELKELDIKPREKKTSTAPQKEQAPAWQGLMGLSAAELEQRHEKAKAERDALSGKVAREETPAAASSYAAVSGRYKAKETNPIPSVAAASGAWVSEEEKRLAPLRLDVSRKQDEVNDLATAHYHRKNQEQFSKLETDAGAKAKFRSAQELASDLDAISKALSAPTAYNGQDTRFKSDGEALKQKYGVNDLQDLQRTLTAQKAQMVKELEAKGYDFETMAGYDLMLRKQEINAKTQEKVQRDAEEHPVSASALSTLISPLQGTDYFRTVFNGVGHSNADDLGSYVPASTNDMYFTNMSQTIRGTVAKDIEEKWGPVGSFAYQTGMSMADFLFNAAITGNFAGAAEGSVAAKAAANLSLAIMGSSAASNATMDAINRGLSNRQAFGIGAVAGVAEIVTEKVSLDALLGKLSEGKGALTYFLTNVVSEGSEEGTSDLINWTADVLIAGDKSEWKQAIAAYKGQGEGDKQAFLHALRDKALEIGVDVAGGMLSGGVLSGGSIMVNAYQNKSVGRDWRKSLQTTDTGVYQAFIDTGLESDPNSEAYRVAQKAQAQLDENGELSDSMLGRLYRANLAAIEAEGDVDIQDDQNGVEGLETPSGEVAQETSKTAQDVNQVLADYPLAQRMGKNGQTGISQVITELRQAEGVQDGVAEARLVEGYIDLYMAGLNGTKLESGAMPLMAGENAQKLTVSQRMQAYYNGVNDAAARVEANKRAANFAKVAGSEKGLVYDSYVENELTAEMADRINDLAKRLNLRVGFVDSIDGGIADGKINGADILVAKDAQSPEMVVLGHEVGHWLEKTAPEEYQALRQFVSQQRQEEINYRMAVYETTGKEMDYDAVAREFVNDDIGQMIADPEVLDKFINENRENRTLLQRVADALRALWKKLTGKERKQVKTAEDALLAALHASEKQTVALEKAGQTMDFATETAEDGAEYSLKQFADGRRFVDVDIDQEMFDGLDEKEKVKQATQIIRERFVGKIIGTDNPVFVNGETAREYGHPAKPLSSEVRDVKMRAAPELDKLVDAGFNFRTKPDGADGHIHPKVTDDYVYFDTTFKVGQEYYSGVVNIEQNAKGRRLKDITKIRNITQDIRGSYGETPATTILHDVSTHSMPQKSSGVNGDFSLKDQGRVVELERENAALQAKYEQAMKQTRRSDAGKVSEAQVNRFSKMLMDHIGVKGDAKAVALKMQALFDGMASGHDIEGGDFTYQHAVQLARDIAGDLVRRAVLQDDTLYQDYADLRGYIRSHSIVVDAETRADITDYEDFRKRNMGRLRLKHGETGNIDQVYNELSQEYPGLFDPEITYGQDQLERIAEVMEQVYARKEFNPWAGDIAGATQTFANEIMEQFWELPGEKATYADRQWRQREELKRRHMAEIQNAVRAEREKGKVERQKLKQWYAEKAAEQRAYKADSEARNRLLKLAARMKRMPVDNTNKTLIKQLVGELDTEARHLTGKKLAELTELRQYVEGKANPDSDIYDTDFILDKRTADNLRRLEMKHIDDMDLQDVKDLTQVLLNLENELRTSKRLIGMEEARDTYQLGEQVIKDIRATKGSKTTGVGGALDKLIITETLSPLRQIRRMVGYNVDSPLVKLTEGLADGSRKMMDYQMRAEKPFERFAQDKDFTKRFSGKDAETVKISGWVKDELQEVEITPAMRVSLWLHSQNDQNLLHMRDGGVRVPDMTLYKQGKIAEAYAAGTVVKLSPEMAKSLWGKMTQTERAFAKATQEYFSKVSQPAINEVSRQLKGYDIAEVENYYPIHTDKTFNRAELETLKFDGTIEGMGFLKERQSFAHNPMMLEDVNSVVEQAIRMHGKYVGLAIPVRNFGKVWNVSTAVQSESGDWVSYGDSVQNAVQAVWGKTGYDYITKMMTDIQGGGKQAPAWAKTLGKVRSNYAGAVLTLNASVAMKQAASYPTAAAVLGWGPLVKAMGDVGKVDLDLIAKYTPLQWYRSKGFATKELGDIQNYGGVMKNVLSHKALNWVQGIDLVTTRKLWKASEYYVQENSPNLQKGSDAYYKAVADIYNRVIEETQPNYTTMQRPQLLRSDDTLMGNLAMFKTQPFQNFNVLYDAAGEYRAIMEKAKAGEATQAEITAARKKISRAVTSQVAQLGVFAGMTMLWAMFRGRKDKYADKDGDLTLWSALGGLGKDVGSGIAGMVPFGTEAYEFGSSKLFGERYYGMEPVSVEAISNAGKSLSKLGDTIWNTAQSALNGEDIDWKSGLYQLDDSADDISKVAGIPYENVMNLFNGFARWALIGAKGKYLGEYAALHLTTNAEKTQQPYMDLLYKAMENDQKEFDALWTQMVKDGFDSGKIKSAMESRMKKSQGVTKAAELEERYVAPDDREVYERAIERLTGSSLYQKATEEQMKDAKADAYEFATRAGGEKNQEKWDRWEAAGMDAGTYALYQLAKEMADEANNDNGHIDAKEREAAIRSMTGLTTRERAALWTLAGGSEKSNPWG